MTSCAGSRKNRPLSCPIEAYKTHCDRWHSHSAASADPSHSINIGGQKRPNTNKTCFICGQAVGASLLAALCTAPESFLHDTHVPSGAYVCERHEENSAFYFGWKCTHCYDRWFGDKLEKELRKELQESGNGARTAEGNNPCTNGNQILELEVYILLMPRLSNSYSSKIALRNVEEVPDLPNRIMPPRIQFSLPLRTKHSFVNHKILPQVTYLSLPPVPVTSHTRFLSILSALSDVPSAYGHRIRRGRGPSSGKGKTAGRGHKGQKQHGKVPAGFEGGQTPIAVVKGKRGFTNIFSPDLQVVPLTRIQSWITQGRIDPKRPITVKELIQSRCVHSGRTDGIKLLATSHSHAQSTDEIPPLTQPLHIVVSRASASAIAEVEKAGGTVTTRYYTKAAIRQIMMGNMDPTLSLQSPPTKSKAPSVTLKGMGPRPSQSQAETAQSMKQSFLENRYPRRLPDPTSRKDIEYYRDAKHRGYLSYTVEEGGIPSLFFKTPRQERAEAKARKAKELEAKGIEAQAANQLW